MKFFLTHKALCLLAGFLVMMGTISHSYSISCADLLAQCMAGHCQEFSPDNKPKCKENVGRGKVPLDLLCRSWVAVDEGCER